VALLFNKAAGVGCPKLTPVSAPRSVSRFIPGLIIGALLFGFGLSLFLLSPILPIIIIAGVIIFLILRLIF